MARRGRCRDALANQEAAVHADSMARVPPHGHHPSHDPGRPGARATRGQSASPYSVPVNGDMFDDTEPQPILRFDADPAPGGSAESPTDVLPQPSSRRGRHAWLVAVATAVVVALGATGYLISRQAPAAARGPATTSSTTSDTTGGAVPPTASAAASGARLAPGQDTLVLGDSLALAVYPYLADLVPDRYVSYVGEVGSSTEWALSQVEQLQAQGERIPRVVIVSAGTNDWYARDFRHSATRLLERLGPKRCVVWSSVARPEVVNGTSVDPAEDLNAVLADLAATHPNLRVLDWAGAATANPAWLTGDGIHPNDEGTMVRAQMFADASYACSPRDPDAPVADKQYLPLSTFYAGGGAPGSGEQPSYAPSVEPTPHASRSSEPTPTKTRKPKPTKTSEPPPTQTTSEPPPAHTDEPPAPSDPPPGDGGGDAGGDTAG